jgi:uncharacterized repeat protein (TIGR03803 family)
MTTYGGATNSGTIFRVNPDGSDFALLHSFAGGASDGWYPSGSLIESGGMLYGMTPYGGAGSEGTVFRSNLDGSDFALLRSFAVSASDGSYPSTVIESGGLLYGVTQSGGASGYGGTIFKINPDGSDFALLRSFAGGASDGRYPAGALLESGGVFYGTTLQGGTSDLGTIFRINRDGTGFGVLYSFGGYTTDGTAPSGALVEFGGVLYGTAAGGGASDMGTIFRINPDGSGFAVLHSFSGSPSDGQNPYSALIESGGVLYGVTLGGGTSDNGTIFRINPNGSGFAILRFFAGGIADGARPNGKLLPLGGVLFGVTGNGGTSGLGTLFRINPDGSGFALVHSFSGSASDGISPAGSLIESGGVLYGATSRGGAGDDGTIFKVNSDGSGYALLHSFSDGDSAGVSPGGPFTPFAGSLYGATNAGGPASTGVLFRLDVHTPRARRHLGRE